MLRGVYSSSIPHQCHYKGVELRQ